MNRILVTGSREWTDGERLAAALLNFSRGKGTVLVHGGAPGADLWAAQYADEWGWTPEEHRADWRTCAPECPPNHKILRRGRGAFYCPTAGHRRNQKMVDLGGYYVVLAFFKEGAANRGTRDCVQRAMDAGLRVVRVFG